MPPIRVPKSFKKRLGRKTPDLAAAIIECIERLGENPRHQSLQTHPVRGKRGVFEAYVDSGNRLTFEWDGPTIVLRNHCNHDIIKQSP